MLTVDANKLIKARGERSQRAIAAAIGVHHSYICRLETGTEPKNDGGLPHRTLPALAQAYGLNSFLDLCSDLDGETLRGLRRSIAAQVKEKNLSQNKTKC